MALLWPAVVSFQPCVLPSSSRHKEDRRTRPPSILISTSPIQRRLYQATTKDNNIHDDEKDDDLPTIHFSLVAYSGLQPTEVDLVQAAILQSCSSDDDDDTDGLGFQAVTVDMTSKLQHGQVEACQTPGVPGSLGRVALFQTNLDIDSIEVVEAAIAQQMDRLLYDDHDDDDNSCLAQPILMKIWNPSYTNDDLTDWDDISAETLSLIVQDEVHMYQLRSSIGTTTTDDNDDNNDDDTSTTKKSSSFSSSFPQRPPTMDIRLDAATVNVSENTSTLSWWDTSNVLVWDDLISDELREELLRVVVKGNDDSDDKDKWDDILQGPNPQRWVRGGLLDTPEPDDENHDDDGSTKDDGTTTCWGLTDEAIEDLCGGDHPAIRKMEELLATQVFPQFVVTRLPEAVFGACVSPLTANAPTQEDTFSMHIDGDPNLTPSSPWTDVFGRYPNRQVGKPRFVSCLVYLNSEWKSEEWGAAPTRFLDLPSMESYEVVPRPGRCVVMDQDISHTVVPPEASAGRRPRYSLVWKLILHPREDGQDMSLCRERGGGDMEGTCWPDPIWFASASSPATNAIR